jgi:hypothetical protein
VSFVSRPWTTRVASPCLVSVRQDLFTRSQGWQPANVVEAKGATLMLQIYTQYGGKWRSRSSHYRNLFPVPGTTRHTSGPLRPIKSSRREDPVEIQGAHSLAVASFSSVITWPRQQRYKRRTSINDDWNKVVHHLCQRYFYLCAKVVAVAIHADSWAC